MAIGILPDNMLTVSEVLFSMLTLILRCWAIKGKQAVTLLHTAVTEGLC